MVESKNMSDSDERLLVCLVLSFFGLAVGAALGWLFFYQLPPRYKATALIQVVKPPKEIPISTFDIRMDTRSHGDELVVVRSFAVLMNAVEVGHLTQHRQLMGKSAAEIVQMLKDPKTKMLEVRLGSKDLNSDIIDISVTTENADLSGEIVQAIVSGYENHVNQKVNAFSKDAEFGAKSVTRLEIPTIGRFAGPYWARFVGLGTLFGVCAFGFLGFFLC